jgi:hypothetical protein
MVERSFPLVSEILQAANVFDVVLLWGISLSIENPFMIATRAFPHSKAQSAGFGARPS